MIYGPAQAAAAAQQRQEFAQAPSPQTVGGGGNLYAAAQAAATTTPQGQVVNNSALNALAGMSVIVPAEQGTQTMDAQQYAMQFYNWGNNDLNWFRNQMGLINSNYYTATNDQLATAWFDYVRQSAERNAAGNPVTPEDLLQADITATGGGKGKADRTITKTINQVNLTNTADAQAIFFQAAQNLLGRAPTDAENAQFKGYLNQQEQLNPIHQVQQLTYNQAGLVVDKNVLKSSGGITSQGAAMLAEQQARQNPEYGAYQAATTYMNALRQALGLGG